jgi:hypothetical protein
MDKVGAIGVGDGVGVGVGTGVGVGVGVGSATGNDFFTVTPLFHNNLLPDFMQVNFLPLAVAVAPALVHFAPALTAANEGAVIRERDRTNARRRRARVMPIRYQSTIPNQID